MEKPRSGLILTLPWPPSVNTYWRHPNKGKLAGRHLISEAGRAYRSTVKAICWQERVKPLDGRLNVSILACQPDRRVHDLDNLQKAILDGLMYGGAYEDDSQIDRLCVERGYVVPGGQVFVKIETWERGDAWAAIIGELPPLTVEAQWRNK